MWKELGIVALTAASAGVIYYGGYDLARSQWEAKVEHAKAEAAETYARRLEVAVKASQVAGENHEVEVQRINTTYRTITKEIPHAIPPEVDARYPLPWAYVRLLDAAAEGRVPAAPAAGEPDADPSGLSLTAAVDTGVDNARTCAVARRQLIDLQALVRAQPRY